VGRQPLRQRVFDRAQRRIRVEALVAASGATLNLNRRHFLPRRVAVSINRRSLRLATNYATPGERGRIQLCPLGEAVLYFTAWGQMSAIL
jgi:hypothetical protein